MRALKAFVAVSVMVLSSILVMPVLNAEISTCSESSTFFVDDDFNETVPGWNVTSFSSIQSAIDNASENDTIYVYNGIYNENLVIDKPLNLTGEDNEETVIRSNFEGYVIWVNADNVHISNFKIVTDGLRPIIYVSGCDYVDINENRLFGDGTGLRLRDSSFNNIHENYFSGARISVYESNSNKITNNFFFDACISVSSSHNNEISQNEIKTVDTGILIDENSYDNFISYNKMENCGFGINIGGSGKNTISYNDFISNKYFDAFILSSDCTWKHNYWGRSRILPKIIFGLTGTRFVIDFDLNPAKTPNCDFGGDS